MTVNAHHAVRYFNAASSAQLAQGVHTACMAGICQVRSTRPRRARHPARTRPVARPHCFNPRARQGRDVRRVTCPATGGCFNPRAREGRDACAASKDARQYLFQSTRPRRARPATAALAASLPKFQSTRPRRARPLLSGKSGPTMVVSIHAPAKGATTSPVPWLTTWTLFQSTRPRRARRPSG